MPIERYELASYAVSLIAGEAEREPTMRPAATIHGRPKPGESEAEVAIYFRFYRPEAPVPPNSRTENDDGSRLYMVSYRYDQLASAVDLLRNEKPIFFQYDVEAETGYLATTDEPVGEGERSTPVRRKPPLPPKKS